jgi:hypothetical protein
MNTGHHLSPVLAANRTYSSPDLDTKITGHMQNAHCHGSRLLHMISSFIQE